MSSSDILFDSDAAQLTTLLLGMREAFSRGENAMEYARHVLGAQTNSAVATLIAYDLQAGSYVHRARTHAAQTQRWGAQLAALLNPWINTQTCLLEVGCGEATTLASVLQHLDCKPLYAAGFDISWSRCHVGKNWLNEQQADARLFVADLFHIPLQENSVDVVYTSHSLEPNGGREQAAIRELLRIARRAVVLVEPLYELASVEAQTRMRQHGYVTQLEQTARDLGATIGDYRLLNEIANPLNPSGVLVLHKNTQAATESNMGGLCWQCPLTGVALESRDDVYVASRAGLAYPVIRGIPYCAANML